MKTDADTLHIIYIVIFKVIIIFALEYIGYDVII